MNDLKQNRLVGIVVYFPIDESFAANGERIMLEIFILAMSGEKDSLNDEAFDNIFYLIFRCSGL
jgi:hypothetical protein